MDATLLQKAAGCSAAAANTFAGPMTAAMEAFSISTTPRIAAFLAQTAYESALFTSLEEHLSYSAARLLQVWPSRFTPETASLYANNPEKLANYVYANRNGNGDEASGDGYRYRGRGLIELTFKNNYLACFQGLCYAQDASPDLIAQPDGAAQSAAWFWSSRGLNQLADAQLFQEITRRVNGGLLGLDQRTSLYHRALDALNQ